MCDMDLCLKHSSCPCVIILYPVITLNRHTPQGPFMKIHLRLIFIHSGNPRIVKNTRTIGKGQGYVCTGIMYIVSVYYMYRLFLTLSLTLSNIGPDREEIQ